MDARDKFMWAILGVLMNNLDACENDVNTMLASSIGQDASFIRSMGANDYIDLIVQYVTREEFADFFMHAAKLLQKMEPSQNSIANAVTSIK